MEKKKAVSFTLLIVAIILGVTLYKQFDFNTFTFQKPALAVVYGIVFVSSMFFIIRSLIAKKQ